MYFSKDNNDSHLKISGLNIEYFYINTKHCFIFEKCLSFSSLLLWNMLYLFTLCHSLHTSVKDMKKNFNSLECLSPTLVEFKFLPVH